MPVTILGDKLAVEGQEFEYRGKVDKCYRCDLMRVCHQLEEGRWYRVTNVRDTTHPEEVCGVFDGDVRVVDVEEVAPLGSIPTGATRGTSTRWGYIECDYACPYKRFCQADALNDGERVEIKEEMGPAEPCAKGLDLTIARLRPLDR